MAIGAADAPPWPAPTSITATATFGFEAGAKATNQAVVFFAFWAMSAVETSSAVPVLPATVTPGIAAAIPGAELRLLDDAAHLYTTDEPRADEAVLEFLLAA